MIGGPETTERAGRPRALRRILEQRQPTDPGGSSIDGGAPWLSGVLCAVQALLFSLAIVLVPAIAMTVAANAQVDATTSGWASAVPVATRIWLLGHGVPLAAGGVSLTLVPLGITVLAVVGALVSARRTIKPTLTAWAAAVSTYTVMLVFLTLLSGERQAAQLGAAVLGGLAVGLCGFTWGVLTRPDSAALRRKVGALVERMPILARTGLRGGAIAAAIVLALAGVLVLVWVILGRSTIFEVLHGLKLDDVSTLSLGVSQLAVLPNLGVWAVAWIVGPGFSVGSGTHFGADSVVSGPLPAIPLLGALPTPTTDSGLLGWAPMLVVVAGAVGGWFVHHRLERMLWWHVFLLAGLVGAGAGGLLGGLVAVASGVAGPGRLGDVGAAGVFTGLLVAAQVAGGALVVLLLVRPEIREAIGEAWHRARSQGAMATNQVEADARPSAGATAAEPGPEPTPATTAPEPEPELELEPEPERESPARAPTRPVRPVPTPKTRAEARLGQPSTLPPFPPAPPKDKSPSADR